MTGTMIFTFARWHPTRRSNSIFWVVQLSKEGLNRRGESWSSSSHLKQSNSHSLPDFSRIVFKESQKLDLNKREHQSWILKKGNIKVGFK